MSTPKKIVVVTSILLTLSISSTMVSATSSYKNTTSYEKVSAVENGEIENVVEAFISNSFNLGISDFDTSLIDPESSVFIEFFRLRNEYRKNTLATVGYNESNLKHISREFKFNTLKVNGETAYVDVDESYEHYYDNDTEPGEGTINYKVLLRKVGDAWKIHACTSDDNISNQYDARVQLEDLVDFSLTDKYSKSTKSSARLDINKLKNDVNRHWRESTNTNIDINSDVGYPEPPKRRKRDTSGYVDRTEMKNYARKYAKNYNTREYETFPADCANFGSQILHAGGATRGGGAVMDGSFRLWDKKGGPSNSWGYGHAWTVANYLRGYIVRNNSRKGPVGRPIKYGSKLETGDFCFLDLDGDGRVDHTTIVVDGGPNFRIASHTRDRYWDRIDTIHPAGKDGKNRSYIKIDFLY